MTSVQAHQLGFECTQLCLGACVQPLQHMGFKLQQQAADPIPCLPVPSRPHPHCNSNRACGRMHEETGMLHVQDTSSSICIVLAKPALVPS